MKPWVPIAALALALSPLLGFHPVRVSGRSMEPALHDGDLVWAMRAWCAGMPRRRQVWVVKGPEGISVKRVIGLPSDLIESKKGKIFLQGIRLSESYVERSDSLSGAWDCQDGYLVLGDNRPESHDGRAWGALPRSSLRDRILISALGH